MSVYRAVLLRQDSVALADVEEIESEMWDARLLVHLI